MLDKIQQIIYGGSLQHGDPNKNKHDKQQSFPVLNSSQCLFQQATSLLRPVTKFNSQIVVRVDFGSLQEKIWEVSVSSFSKMHQSHASTFTNSQVRKNLIWPIFTNLKNPFFRDILKRVQQACHYTEIYFMLNNTVIIQRVSKIIIHYNGFAPKGYLWFFNVVIYLYYWNTKAVHRLSQVSIYTFCCHCLMAD